MDEHYATILRPEDVVSIQNRSERWFARGFFESILFKLGFQLTYQPDESFETINEFDITKSTRPDFKLAISDAPYPVFVEVTESLTLKGKKDQRQVIRAQGDNTEYGYVQFSRPFLEQFDLSATIIQNIAYGFLNTRQALSCVSKMLQAFRQESTGEEIYYKGKNKYKVY